MLSTRSLHFTRADLLGDSHEGSVSALTVESYNGNQASPLSIPDVQQTVSRLRQLFVANTWVQCWHASDGESMDMWRTYGSRQAGLAIRSSVGSLVSIFDKFPDPVYIGKVQYVDYEAEPIEGHTFLAPLTHKRSAFRAENEVRAVVSVLPSKHGCVNYSVTGQPGLLVPVQLDQLVDVFVVAPNTPEWTRTAIEATLRGFGLNIPVVRSSLDRPPIF